MKHVDVKKRLADYLEGDLGLDDRALVDAHLDQCEHCEREVTELRRTIELLRMLPEPETPPMIAANVMRRIRAGESRPSLFRRALAVVSGILEPSFVLPASAVAAAALVVVVLQEPTQGGLGALFRGVDASQATVDPSAASLRETRTGSVVAFDARSGMSAATVVGTPSSGFPRSTAGTSARSNFMAASSADSGFGEIAGRAEAERRRIREPARRRIELDGSSARRMVFPDSMLVPPIPSALVADTPTGNRSIRVQSGLLVPSSAFDLDRRVATGMSDARSGARVVSQSLAPRAVGSTSSGGEDARDAWIARGLERPADFARFLGEKTLAEQELWVTRLAQRAESRGLLEELLVALQASGDDRAVWLAKDFAAEAERLGGQSSPTRAAAGR